MYYSRHKKWAETNFRFARFKIQLDHFKELDQQLPNHKIYIAAESV
jgi:hypothetical protein